MAERFARTIVTRPRQVLLGVLAALALLSVGLSRAEFRTDQGTLVDSGSQVFQDNVRYQSRFGGETMLVLFTGDPVALFTDDGGAQIAAFEEELRSTPGVATVVGPHGSLTFGRDQLTVAPELLGAAAARAEDSEAYLAQLGVELDRLGAAGAQQLDNGDFVRFLLFDAAGEVRGPQRSTFPDAEHALVVVQLEGNASIEVQGQAADAISGVVDRYDFAGYDVLVSGTPALLGDINDYLQGGMATLGLMALLVMTVVLWLAFRVRWRLLPLAVMAIGTAAAIGAASLAGIGLSLVTISGLPIFIGLGVDFAIQVHNRYVEQREAGDSPAAAVETSVAHMSRPLVVAMVAGALGFLALVTSPVPMIRDFGLLLCIGVVVLVACALVLPATILLLADRGRVVEAPPATRAPGALERAVARASGVGGRAIALVVGIGAVIAVAGFIGEGRTPVDTEVEHWVSPSADSVRDLEDLRSQTGFSSLLGIMVEADDVTDDDVVAWMRRFEQTELARHPDALLQVASASDIAAGVVGIVPTGEDIRTLLAVAPSDIQRSVLTEDRTAANLQLSIGDLSLDERGDLIDAIEADLRGELAPPEGVTVTPSGLAVIGTELVHGLEANRQSLTLLALGLVALWLLVRGRFRPRALLPVVPVAMAVGLASGLIWALGFELTPLTTVAAPLVIAVATEFTVLLQARYDEERAMGRSPAEAIAVLPRIGRAFVASGLTLAGGFAVLAASPMPLLRDFGVVVALDVVIALVSALVVMPPLLRWADHAAADPTAADTLAADTIGSVVPVLDQPPAHSRRGQPLHARR